MGMFTNYFEKEDIFRLLMPCTNTILMPAPLVDVPRATVLTVMRNDFVSDWHHHLI
jgi:hypothetical protein